MAKRIELNGFVVCAEIETVHYPAERRTRDYPGYPEHWEIAGVKVTRAIGECYDVRREERPDWFAFLDEALSNILENEPEILG